MRRLLAVLAALTSVLMAATMLAGPATAAKGRNDANAKLCQKGGWKSVYTAAGDAFASEEACTSYGAQGGTYSTRPNFATACAQFGGTHTAEGTTSETCTNWVVRTRFIADATVLHVACLTSGWLHFATTGTDNQATTTCS